MSIKTSGLACIIYKGLKKSFMLQVYKKNNVIRIKNITNIIYLAIFQRRFNVKAN